MDEEALARVFEPYFSTKTTGTGLGLPIARRNIEFNGGAIEVETGKGRGTTVVVRLPISSTGIPQRDHTEKTTPERRKREQREPSEWWNLLPLYRVVDVRQNNCCCAPCRARAKAILLRRL